MNCARFSLSLKGYDVCCEYVRPQFVVSIRLETLSDRGV